LQEQSSDRKFLDVAAILSALLDLILEALLREYPLVLRRADAISRDKRPTCAALISAASSRMTLRPPAGWQAS
jgi:hypothetical protein